MSQYFEVHPQNPQPRLIRQAVASVRTGGLIAYPTDSCYALGCHIGDKAALERLARIRQVDARHNFTLVCRDLSEIATYAKVADWAYRLLKQHTPGPYTFILPASREVPRRVQHAKRRTIGIRVPEHPVALALLTELGEPLLSSTLILPDDPQPLTDPEEVRERLARQVDVIIDGGPCGVEPTTVVELGDEGPVVTRVGRGDPAPFLPRP